MSAADLHVSERLNSWKTRVELIITECRASSPQHQIEPFSFPLLSRIHLRNPNQSLLQRKVPEDTSV